MSKLEISDRARDIMLRAAWPVTDPTPERVSEAFRSAACLVVADELRRMANKNPHTGMGKLLLARADILETEAGECGDTGEVAE